MEMMSARDKKKGDLVPRLRFPEFQDAGEWEPKKLDDICTRILQKVTDDSLVPVSITAGQGFVSQESKFGKNISGAQYKNYIFLKYGDFAYNKGNSKKFPQGYVCQLKEFEQAAASSAFLCFRFTIKYQATFFQGLFDNNIHGKQLVKYITSGARSDGLLNIKPDVFFSILLPVPYLYSEQQRIADCLSSLDERIGAETSKLNRLKDHKKGLLKQLFPAEGETLPQLRFPDFRDAGEWGEKAIGDTGEIVTGNTPRTTDPENYDGDRPFVSPVDISENRFIYQTKTMVTEQGFKKGRIIPPQSILFVCIGSTIGKIAQNFFECITNQQINSIIPYKSVSSDFLYFLLLFYSSNIAALAGNHAVPIVNKSLFSSFSILLPLIGEQKRIADCLSSLDELITAQTQKIDLLKDHKKGLMQQLFPRIDEV